MASNQLQDGQVQEAFRNDQAKGVPVHTFDPDATPQEKAAAAGKARDQLKDVRSKQPDPVKGSSPSVSEPARSRGLTSYPRCQTSLSIPETRMSSLR